MMMGERYAKRIKYIGFIFLLHWQPVVSDESLESDQVVISLFLRLIRL